MYRAEIETFIPGEGGRQDKSRVNNGQEPPAAAAAPVTFLVGVLGSKAEGRPGLSQVPQGNL